MMSKTYLTPGGYAGRAVIYFAIWWGLAFILNRWSMEQDNPPVQNLSPRFRTIAAPGIILYAFTITFASIDWVMSLDPKWFSTIFGFIIIAGECLSAMCLMVVVERILVRYQPMARCSLTSRPTASADAEAMARRSSVAGCVRAG